MTASAIKRDFFFFCDEFTHKHVNFVHLCVENEKYQIFIILGVSLCIFRGCHLENCFLFLPHLCSVHWLCLLCVTVEKLLIRGKKKVRFVLAVDFINNEMATKSHKKSHWDEVFLASCNFAKRMLITFQVIKKKVTRFK